MEQPKALDEIYHDALERQLAKIVGEKEELEAREVHWKELHALYLRNIQKLSGLHIAHGATQLGSDEDIARGKELRELLGINN